MEHQTINEARVEAAFDAIESLRLKAWRLSLSEVAALSERVRVELILDKTVRGARKRWYKAYADYLDEAIEERLEKHGHGRLKPHKWAGRVVVDAANRAWAPIRDRRSA